MAVESRAKAQELRAEAERAAESKSVEWLGRAGLLAQGFSYGLVGVLALMLAVGVGGKTTSRQGALKTLADEPGGMIVLGLLALGFAGYAIWRFAEAIFDRGDEGTDAKGLGKRATSAGKGVIYLGLTVATLSILLGSGGGSGSGSEEEKATGGVLGWPAGRYIVFAAGLVIVGVGAYQIYRGVSAKFFDDMETSEMSAAERRWTQRLGVFGLSARGVVFGIIGWFLIKAAVEYDPDEAAGLDEALATLAQASYGPFLLGMTATGLVAFGLFCAAQSRYRQI